MPGDSDAVAREAVEAVRLALTRDLRWYPREPTAPDHGIDLYVECADHGKPNGQMLGIQVKGGPSFFRESSEDGVVFRGAERHLQYWRGHSLPVIVVLYDPDQQSAWWQAVTPETVRSTGRGWKLVVPWAQPLDATACAPLFELTQADEYTLRLNSLRADLDWMQMLRNGGTVSIEVEEWANKTSGRGAITLIGHPPQGHSELRRVRDVYLGLLPYEEVLPRIFPWAELEIDEDVYSDYEQQQWELEEGIYDSEEGRMIVVGPSFEDWRERRGLAGLRPYVVEADEIARWRLVLSLSELGRTFLVVNEHLSGES